MCWSGEASAALATLGFASTAFAWRKGDSPALWLSLGYFTLMEALQAYTYRVIDHCELPANQVATLLGYLHICFQPFFINAVSLYFIDKAVARKVAIPAYTICFAGAIMMLLKLYPFPWAGHCTPGVRPMCGTNICSFHGNWHIAWSLPVNTINDNFSWYLLAGFIVPFLYGSWRFTLFHLFLGPVLARLTTTNLNEWPAIWCLLSIDLLLIITNTRVRGWMFVERWPLWGLFQKKPAPPETGELPIPQEAT